MGSRWGKIQYFSEIEISVYDFSKFRTPQISKAKSTLEQGITNLQYVNIIENNCF